MPATHRPLDTRARFLTRFGQEAVTVSAALAAGFTRGQIDAAVRRGLLTRPRYGVLRIADGAVASEDSWAAERAKHVADLRAALRTLHPGTVAVAGSAAVVHGLLTPDPSPPERALVAGVSGWGHSGDTTLCRSTPLPAQHCTVVDGIPVTSVERTAVDLARGLPLASALIALDSAARLIIASTTGRTGNALRHDVLDIDLRGLAADRLRDAVETCHGYSGIVRVRAALEHVDPASESPLESRSRAWFLQSGLGPLAPGTPVRCQGTTYWADFCDPRRRIIGEADGWSKYGATAGDVGEALRRERERAARLQDDGWTFVRWTSSDARPRVLARMRHALNAADQR